MVDGGWQWLAVGGWWRLAVGGGWWLAVGGPLGRSLRAVLNKKKSSSLLTPLCSGKLNILHTAEKRYFLLRICPQKTAGRLG